MRFDPRFRLRFCRRLDANLFLLCGRGLLDYYRRLLDLHRRDFFRGNFHTSLCFFVIDLNFDWGLDFSRGLLFSFELTQLLAKLLGEPVFNRVGM